MITEAIYLMVGIKIPAIFILSKKEVLIVFDGLIQ